MDYIAFILRDGFKEFCSANMVLSQIDDAFRAASIRRTPLPQDRIVSGQRRLLVEEYYNSLNWTSRPDAEKFTRVLTFVLFSPRLATEAKLSLEKIVSQAGLIVSKDEVTINSVVSSKSKLNLVIPDLSNLKSELIQITSLPEQRRGYELEKLLQKLFETHNLKPRAPFRNIGEQIDGSFQLGNEIYLVEAKWQKAPTPQSDLLIFREKITSKSSWTRGLFISISGFTEDGLTAFAKGRVTNMIGLSGEDLYLILDGICDLATALETKIRLAAETGDFYVPVYNFSHN